MAIDRFTRERMAAGQEVLLTPGQVAEIFRVSPKAVAHWATRGWIPCIKLPSGHRRYYWSDVRKLLKTEGETE